MSTVSWTSSVARSPSEVFAYLADLRNTANWYPSVDNVELVAGAPGEHGARYRLTHERRIFDDTVIDYVTDRAEPDREIVFLADHPKLSSIDTYTLTPRDGGTEVEAVSELTYKKLNKLNAPVGDFTAWLISQNLGDRLKAQLESDD